ncbi:uncharacterized protein [Arachis hypogaea]|uniref:uncharacterized protein n=1 Tax=Arachis hypogaea TaxID=3818 RepID=UPI0010FC4C01|nr:uncharacterized protein LOC114927761 [Arachis hypogaea]
MNLALKSKNKLRFIDGSLDKPEKHDPLFEASELCNAYVVGWINHSLEPDIAKSVSWNTIALDLWEDLKHRYYQSDCFRIVELQEELYATKQGEMSVTVYFKKLKTIWEDLDSFRAIPSCECGRSAQTITQPATLLNTTEAFQGRGRGRGRGGKNPGFRRGQGGRGKMQCSHCGKIEHVVDTCYKKHGLPPHLKQRYNTVFTNISAAEFDSEGSNENLRNPYSGQDGDVTSLDFTPKQK